MTSPTAAYLLELRRCLAGASAEDAKRVLAEAADHLRESSASYQLRGLSRVEAEMRAVTDLGPAWLLTVGLEEDMRMIEMEVKGIAMGRPDGVATPVLAKEILAEADPELAAVGVRASTPREREADGKSTPIVILRERDGARELRIWVGAFEAASIALALEGHETPRPMTHDFLASIASGIEGVTPDAVEITRCTEGTFYAQLTALQAARRIVFDCRPSDGIAVAVRLGLPVRVADGLTEHFTTAA